MKKIIKNGVVFIFALSLVCGLFSVIGMVSASTGTYSELTGNYDKGSKVAHAIAKNKTGTTRYLQVQLYDGHANLLATNEGAVSAGGTKQATKKETDKKTYDVINGRSSIYRSSAPASGAIEGLSVRVK